MVVCHKHLKRNVRTWVRDHGGTADDRKVYVHDLKLLLLAEYPEQSELKYENLSERWSTPFKNYFDTHIKPELPSASKYFYEQFPTFSNQSPTNNCSESFNEVIKSHLEWKKLPWNGLALSMHKLQLQYVSDGV